MKKLTKNEEMIFFHELGHFMFFLRFLKLRVSKKKCEDKKALLILQFRGGKIINGRFRSRKKVDQEWSHHTTLGGLVADQYFVKNILNREDINIMNYKLLQLEYDNSDIAKISSFHHGNVKKSIKEVNTNRLTRKEVKIMKNFIESYQNIIYKTKEMGKRDLKIEIPLSDFI